MLNVIIFDVKWQILLFNLCFVPNFDLVKCHAKRVFIQGAPKRPDTFENLIEIKRVDENNRCLHFWKAYSMPFCAVSKKQSTMHL